ncbi:hypothetical protein E2562_022138 [Oryza meyeriana var. granulata]|uniref:Uncharacterized protein n=1 Tax=Oryza meyeriana var. granulata TaxID=110450 RepID=A0A6G1BMX4_9ORYZ|nr:hypothetical protein E2562_022138 [Oryza meyeriana var. granulata]
MAGEGIEERPPRAATRRSLSRMLSLGREARVEAGLWRGERRGISTAAAVLAGGGGRARRRSRVSIHVEGVRSSDGGAQRSDMEIERISGDPHV